MTAIERVRNVGILIFEDVEVLDFCGPYEVFTAARTDDERYFNTFTVAESLAPVKARAGLRTLPDFTIDKAPPIDILVVPGGQGTRREVDNPRLIEWIRNVAEQAELTTSVCTGSFLLGQAGLLDNGRATTHWRSIERMRETFPAVEVVSDVRWVDAGNVVTAAGISAGIDMSLHVIERLSGVEVAALSARRMEYDHWNATSVAG